MQISSPLSTMQASRPLGTTQTSRPLTDAYHQLNDSAQLLKDGIFSNPSRDDIAAAAGLMRAASRNLVAGGAAQYLSGPIGGAANSLLNVPDQPQVVSEARRQALIAIAELRDDPRVASGWFRLA